MCANSNSTSEGQTSKKEGKIYIHVQKRKKKEFLNLYMAYC